MEEHDVKPVSAPETAPVQPETKTIEHEGHYFTYSPRVAKSYRFSKACAMADDEPKRFYRALSDLLLGRDDEYADILGGSVDALMDLCMAILEDVGAKKS
jgi:hypothetical protein